MTVLEKEVLRILTKIQKEVVKVYPARVKNVQLLKQNHKGEETEPFGYYDVESHEVFIRLKDYDNSWLSMEEIIDTLAHEIAHAAVPKKWSCTHGRMFREKYLKIMARCLKYV